MEKIKLFSSKSIKTAPSVTKKANYDRIKFNKDFNSDVFVPSSKSGAHLKNKSQKCDAKFLMTAIPMVASTFLSAVYLIPQAPKSFQEKETYLDTFEISEKMGKPQHALFEFMDEEIEADESFYPEIALVEPKSSYTIESKKTIQAQDVEYADEETYVSGVSEEDVVEETPLETNIVQGQDVNLWMSELERCGGDVWENYDVFCANLGLDREQTMKHLLNLCFSPDFGNGTVNPIVLLAQILTESTNNPNAVGDNGNAVGFGQFHTCAVDEVNNQFGTNYSYNDRYDPYKNLEMMVLLLRYDFSVTKSIDGALAMYNVGGPSAINTQKGQNYVNVIYSKLANKPNLN